MICLSFWGKKNRQEKENVRHVSTVLQCQYKLAAQEAVLQFHSPEKSAGVCYTVDVESLTSPTAFISQSADHSVFIEKVLKRSRLYDDIYHVYRVDERIMNTGMNFWKKKGQRDHQIALSSLRTMAINESPITKESSPRETC